jgi:RNA polymerase sporulation-specific sigma factor
VAERKDRQRADETLVALSQSGDKTAQEELLVRYSNLVRFCARKFFLVGGEQEDLIQEGMMGLYHAIANYKDDGGKSFKNFAYLCISRSIMDAVKTASSSKNVPLNTSVGIEDMEKLLSNVDPEGELIAAEDRMELNKTMSRVLTDIEFKVFTMYMDGATRAEICEITGKSAKSVDNAVQRSKKKLMRVLQEKSER